MTEAENLYDAIEQFIGDITDALEAFYKAVNDLLDNVIPTRFIDICFGIEAKTKPKYHPYKLSHYAYLPRFVRNLPYQRREYQGKNG